MDLSVNITIFKYIWPCTEVIFYAFHFLMVLLMMKKRKTIFSGPCYNIFRLLIIADLVYYVVYTVGLRFIIWKIFTNFFLSNPYVPTVVSNILGYLAFVQFFGNVLLSFNRFTLLWFPLKYKTLWKRQWYTVITISLPIVHISYRLVAKGKYIFNDLGIAALSYEDKDLAKFVPQISSYAYLAMTIFEGLFALLSLIKFFTLGKSNSAKFEKREIRLMFITCIIFFAQLLRSGYSFIIPLFADNKPLFNIISPMHTVLIAIGTWTRSLSLIILSKSARKAFIQEYVIFKSSSSIVSTTTVQPFKTFQKK